MFAADMGTNLIHNLNWGTEAELAEACYQAGNKIKTIERKNSYRGTTKWHSLKTHSKVINIVERHLMFSTDTMIF
jgi:hypothetical protein